MSSISWPAAARGAVRVALALSLSFTALWMVVPQADAADVSEEYRRRIESAQNLSALTDDLFGDKISLYNGQTTFTAVDIDVPGNNALPVRLERSFDVSLLTDTLSSPAYDASLGGAGHWDIEVPHISGTFSSVHGWRTYTADGLSDARCSNTGVPSVPSFMELTEVWQGNTVHIPGESERAMLTSTTGVPQPPSGGPYRWSTRERDVFRCIPMLSGVSGEGFAMTTASGVTYEFNRAVTRTASVITRSLAEELPGVRAGRVRIYLLATKVIDRFGNTVEYEYNAAGNLTRIWSSDNREIVLTYDGSGRLSSARTPAQGGATQRTWSYSYHPQYAKRLAQVKLPDSTSWTFDYSNDLVSEIQADWDGGSNASCSVQAPAVQHSFIFKVTHPGGAGGEFEFSNRRMHRSGVHLSSCMRRIQQVPPLANIQYWVLGVPNFFDVMSLARKTISGPGISRMDWTYSYGGGEYDLVNYPVSDAYCVSCTKQKTVTLARPDGSRIEYAYGVLFNHNEGRELGRKIIGADGVVLRTESTYYLADEKAGSQNFHAVFGLGYGGQDSSAWTVRPVVGTQITQDGETFSSLVPETCGGRYCFDSLARPAQQLKNSTLGYSRTDETTYHDNTSLWVLGQVSRVRVLASTPSLGAVPVVSETQFNALALPHVVSEFGQVRQTLSYAPDGTMTTIKDADSRAVTLSSWFRGIPQVIRYPVTGADGEPAGGATQKFVVNGNGWIIASVDENDFVTSYDYDDMGRLSLIEYPTGDTVAWLDTRQTFEPVDGEEYGIPAGHWRQTVISGNSRKISYYDALWRPLVVQEYDSANQAGTQRFTRFSYDYAGRTVFASYPGATSTLVQGVRTDYDALGRTTRVRQDSEIGPLTITTKHLDGFRTEVTPPRGVGARTTTRYFALDAPTTDLPTVIDHPEGAHTVIARDIFGKPRSITRRNVDGSIELTRHLFYDHHQRLCRTVEPETQSTVMQYDNVGNLAWSASGLELPPGDACHHAPAEFSGRRVDRTYDARGRLKTLTFPDGLGDQAWSYAPDGLPTSITTYNSHGGDIVSNSYEYNRRRLLARETFAVGGKLWPLDYFYNALGHMDSYVSPGGTTVAFQPNALGQPTQAGTYATAVEYFPNGGMKRFIYGNGIRHSLSQNPRGLADTSCDHAGNSCGAGAVLNDGYDYDAHGNVEAISDGRTGHRGNRTMGYDALDRLTWAESDMFGIASYGYDVLDNLKTVQVTAGPNVRSHTYVYDERNTLTNVTETSGGGTVTGLEYDAQGNLSNKNGRRYGFDFGNRLREVAGVEQYRYDGHGRRVVAIRNGDALYSVYGQDGTLRFQRDERTGKTIDYVHLNGSLVAQVENAIPLSTPALTVPGSSQTGSYMIRWTESPMATRYQLQERLDSGGWTTIHDEGGSSRFATSKLVSGKTTGIWGYRVRACSATTCGSWSPVRTVAVQLPPSAAPTLTAPSSGPGGNYTLTWSSVTAATTYQLEEQPAGGSWTLIHDAAGVSKAVTGRAAGTWNYRVRACNASGCGGWSATKAVQSIRAPASAPALTVPVTNATGGYTVTWTSIPTSDRYELQERLGTGSWVSIHDAAATSKALSGKTTGSWGYRVRACNVAGCTGYTAEKIVVVTRPPVSAPTLTVPAGNTTGNYTVSWTDVAAATTYQLQERLGAGGWSTVHDAAGTNKAVSGKGSGTWGYRVRGCNSSGCGSWSPVDAVVVTRPPETAPVITGSMKYQRYVGQNIQIRCEVSWTPVATATSYELQAYGGVTQYTGPLTSVTGVFSSASYCAASHVVRACNATGCSAWSSPPFPQGLTVLNEPGEPGIPLSGGEATQGDGE